MIKLLSYAGLAALHLLFINSCSPFARPGQTVLAPTPLAIALGLDGNGVISLRNKDLSQSIPVFICSSRNLDPHGDRVDPFGNMRSEKLVPYLAIAQVSVGRNRSREVILKETLTEVHKKKTRVKVESFEMFDSPNVTPFSSSADKKREFGKNKWLKRIAQELRQSKRKELTIFVHGYNTELVKNTELMGELYHYGGRQGVVINYEWPSAGKLIGYFQDKGNAEHSARMFRSFLGRIAPITGAKNIRIIAHSAGNLIVVNALKDLRLLNDKLTPSSLSDF